MSPTAKPWLSVRDFAELLGVPERTVRAWRLQGRDPESVCFGRHVRYSAAAVDEWIAEQQAPQKVDGKQIGGWVGGTVQAEALAPDQLADELRHAVESVLDLDILGALVATEGDEKTEVLDQLARIDGWSS